MARINLENNAMFTKSQEGRAVRIGCDFGIAAINRWGSTDQDGHQVACRDNIHWYSCDDRWVVMRALASKQESVAC